MHERYTDKEMAQIWSEKNKFEKWFDIELHVAKIQSELGIIPYDVPKTMETLKTACFSYGYVQKINEIEKTTKHDIIAFLTHLSNVIGEPSKYIHYGMTSQDLIDTSQSILVKESNTLDTPLSGFFLFTINLIILFLSIPISGNAKATDTSSSSGFNLKE